MRRTSRTRRWRDRLTGVVAGLGAVALTAGFMVVGVAGSVSADEVAVPGNNGTLKVHEEGTPPGTEDNDPKVCVFNIEGFGFDAGQQLMIRFDVQGGSEPVGVAAGPFGPYTADAQGYFATEYFDLANGTYKSTALGKDTAGDYSVDLKAKSKVFKVDCAPPPPPPVTGSLQWTKVDEGGAPLGGATFEVCPTAGACYPVVDDTAPDADPDAGEFLLTGLQLGEYTVTETVAPEGYVAAAGARSATLTDSDPDRSLGAFVNAPVQQEEPDGTLRWLKVDETGAPLAGATFEACLSGGTCLTVVDGAAPDVDPDDGELELRDLALGTWTITEIEAPDGYVRGSGSETVVLSAGTPANTGDAVPELVNVEEEGEDVHGDLGWLKVDQDGEPLAGATFEVCQVGDADGNDLAGGCLQVTDDKAPDTDPDAGELALADLPLGTWTIEEVEAPQGYEMVADVVQVTLTESDAGNVGDDAQMPEFVNVLSEVDDDDAEEPEVKPAEEERPKPTPATPAPVVQPDQVKGAEAVLPTSVDAGLAGPAASGGATTLWGQGLMAAGLVLMALAAVMKAGRRERGAHEVR